MTTTPRPARVGERFDHSFGPARLASDPAANPYDTRELRAWADIRLPDGSTRRWPLFATQDCALDPNATDPHRTEKATLLDPLPGAPPQWRLRFLPTTPGTHSLNAFVSLRGGAPTSLGQHAFIVEPASAPFPGYIRFGPNQTHFATDDGQLFFPIGANFCWSNMTKVFHGQKLSDLFLMLRRLRDAGGNAYRLWVNAHWAGLTLDWADPADGRPLPFGQISQTGAAKLDAIVEESERLGLGIMFCIDNMNIWSGDQIGSSSYARAQGGPCDKSADYFNLPAARAMTREKMKYLAARWAHSPAIWCWEFWNEIDGVGLDKVSAHSMLAWHQEMAHALRGADPVGHLVTTSTGHPLDFPAMWQIPEIDFTQTHHYGYKDSVDDIVPLLRGFHADAMRLWRKPHMFGELGISWCGPGHAGGWEHDGRTLHNVLWSTTLLPGSCGVGLYWNWDDYIHANDLYHRFTGLSKFLAGERWHELAPAHQPVELLNAPVQAFDPPIDMKIPTCLSGTDYYQSVFTLQRDGTVLIPNLFHGLDQPNYRFRITLHVDYTREGDFTVMVWGGGPNLSGGAHAAAGASAAPADPVAELRLDGQVALSRPVVTTKPKEAKTDYCDRLTLRVPAGRHEIAMENIGDGVFHTGHYILQAGQDRKTLADAQAVRAGAAAYLWVRHVEHQWVSYLQKRELPPLAGLRAKLPGWKPGQRLSVEWWDTVAGRVTQTAAVAADAKGVATMDVPTFQNDVAAKVRPMV
ncbi:MAG: hypothetical protein NTW19_24305 [Planctomycetota bacterium]|nr:hypothetical protein [Planctomycetota bacterium]